MGAVHITLGNGAISGAGNQDDGLCGLIITGSNDDGYTTGTPILVTGMASVATAGITAVGNPLAYRQLQQFYREAGEGAPLYLMLTNYSVTPNMVTDIEYTDGAVKLLDYAQGKIRVLGVLSDDAAIDDGSITDGLMGYVYNALSNAQNLAEAYYSVQKPFRCLIGATSFTGAPGDLAYLDEYDANRVGLVLGDTQAGASAAVGLALGRIAKSPVQRKISRVRDGMIADTIYYGTTDAADPSMAGAAAVIGDRHFITFKSYVGRAGYYFSGDDMATGSGDDYRILANGRVMDKAQRIAYNVFLDEVDDDIPMATGGKPVSSWAKNLETKIKSAYQRGMIAKGEASAASASIPLDQDITGGALNITLGIRPVAYANDIEITLGFTTA
jgi:hypothetical protein